MRNLQEEHEIIEFYKKQRINSEDSLSPCSREILCLWQELSASTQHSPCLTTNILCSTVEFFLHLELIRDKLYFARWLSHYSMSHDSNTQPRELFYANLREQDVFK